VKSGRFFNFEKSVGVVKKINTMAEQQYKEQVNDRRGKVATIIYHLFLLLIFIFAGLKAQVPQPEEEGILINFGTVKAASGSEQPKKVEKPSKKVEAPKTKATPPKVEEPKPEKTPEKIAEVTPPKPEPIVEPKPEPTPPPPPPAESKPAKVEPVEEDLMTSKVNETIALKKKEEERKRKEAEEKAREEEERLLKEKLEQEEAEKKRIEREEYAKAEAAAEKREEKRKERERLEKERIEKEQAEAERIAQEKAEAERKEAERVEAERIAAEKAEAERIAAEKAEAERKEAERRAGEMANVDNFFKGGNKADGDNDSNSQGNKTGAGDQGASNGDINATNMNGDKSTGLGNKGFSYSLSGRSITVKPTIKDDSQKRGTVVIRIKVDRNGNVISASHQIKGSTTSDDYLVQKAIRSAKKAKFNAEPNAAAEQVGTITYVFKVQ